ncbi:MAG: hypothetical protein GY790_07210 [Bacteroidetes bacterium]|nr:hypothetical protein [Bacteroidota bacterium]
MKNRYKYFLIFFLFLPFSLHSQDDLLEMLNEEVEEETLEVAYTFKSTRVLNGHSIERMFKQQLDFRVNHRFGAVNQGWYDFWGIDNALVSLDLGYGITDWLMIGVRRSTYEKVYDGSIKWSILRQTEGAGNFPVAISYYTNLAYSTLKTNPEKDPPERMGYTHQLLVARKFNEAISLQVMPTYVHRNLVDFDEENDIFAMGVGGRWKFHRRVALMVEYFYTSHAAASRKNETTTDFYNPLSLGVDIETGGHVFQLFISNSRIQEEGGFIGSTTDSWLDGGIFFGFNISRVFAIGKVKH